MEQGTPRTPGTLVAQILAARANDRSVDVATVLAGHADPSVRLLGELWARGEESAEPVTDPAPMSNEPAYGGASGDEPTQRARGVRRLRRHLRVLTEEVRELRERNDAVAAALGACYQCWGEDPECETCAGRGRPGSVAPDRYQFQRYVAPTLRRLRPSALVGAGLEDGGAPTRREHHASATEATREEQ